MNHHEVLIKTFDVRIKTMFTKTEGVQDLTVSYYSDNNMYKLGVQLKALGETVSEHRGDLYLSLTADVIFLLNLNHNTLGVEIRFCEVVNDSEEFKKSKIQVIPITEYRHTYNLDSVETTNALVRDVLTRTKKNLSRRMAYLESKGITFSPFSYPLRNSNLTPDKEVRIMTNSINRLLSALIRGHFNMFTISKKEPLVSIMMEDEAIQHCCYFFVEEQINKLRVLERKFMKEPPHRELGRLEKGFDLNLIGFENLIDVVKYAIKSTQQNNRS